MPFRVAFRLELPFGRCVGLKLPAAESVEAAAAISKLHPAERQLVDNAGPWRQVTWAGGRLALHGALADLGLDDGPVLRTDRGAPALPPGVSASISHKDRIAVALAAPSDPGGWRVGVDVESVVGKRTSIERRVLTDFELARVDHLPADQRTRAVLTHFSAKEAVYKALDPFVARYVSFQEIELAFGADERVAVTLRLAQGEGPFDAEVAWRPWDDVVLTCARVRRG